MLVLVLVLMIVLVIVTVLMIVLVLFQFVERVVTFAIAVILIHAPVVAYTCASTTSAPT
jgi:hypothetical protein